MSGITVSSRVRWVGVRPVPRFAISLCTAVIGGRIPSRKLLLHGRVGVGDAAPVFGIMLPGAPCTTIRAIARSVTGLASAVRPAVIAAMVMAVPVMAVMVIVVVNVDDIDVAAAPIDIAVEEACTDGDAATEIETAAHA